MSSLIRILKFDDFTKSWLSIKFDEALNRFLLSTLNQIRLSEPLADGNLSLLSLEIVQAVKLVFENSGVNIGIQQLLVSKKLKWDNFLSFACTMLNRRDHPVKESRN